MELFEILKRYFAGAGAGADCAGGGASGTAGADCWGCFTPSITELRLDEVMASPSEVSMNRTAAAVVSLAKKL